jgi:two-component system, LytTR family, response regulator
MRCLIADDDPLSLAQLERLVRQHGDLELIAACSNAVEAAGWLRREAVDLLILDVEMPEMSGLELLRSLTVRPLVVLVTASASYAVEAFEVEVADFLVKPITPSRFLKTVERLRRQRPEPVPVPSSAGGAQRHLFARVEGRLVRIDFADLQRVEANGDYVVLHTAQKKHTLHATLKTVEERLPGDEYVRVHRSHIVRLDQIVDIEEGTLVIGRDVIPIGASYRPGLLARLQSL